MADYKHGTYGEFADSIGTVATQSGTVAVYVGIAPVNLARGYAQYVNNPVKLTDFVSATRYMGYTNNWTHFNLCEAFKVHFNNTLGNIGPIVAINVLDPDKHKKTAQVTKSLSFVNGRAAFESDTIILDTLVLADKVEGTDFAIDYDFTKGQVIVNSIGTALTGTLQATYTEVDPTMVTSADIIGGATAAGEYTGLGCVGLIYPELTTIHQPIEEMAQLAVRLILEQKDSYDPAIEVYAEQFIVISDEKDKAVPTAEGINLTWFQDDYDTLLGYNIYRSDEKDGYYTKLNPAVLLPTDECSVRQ